MLAARSTGRCRRTICCPPGDLGGEVEACDLDALGGQAALHRGVAGQVDAFLDADRRRQRELVGLLAGVGVAPQPHRAVDDLDALDPVHDRPPEGVGDADADLEPARVGRLVAEQQQVERAVRRLQAGDRLR